MRRALGGVLGPGLLILAALTLSPVGLGAQDAGDTPVLRTPAASQPIATASDPGWHFAVYDLVDPYPVENMSTGPLGQPDVRYVAAYIEIGVSSSGQPLHLSVNYGLRLRDERGHGYNGGLFAGAEPRLNDRLVLPGEKAEGWVWWQVPQGELLQTIVYFPPAPEYRISLPLNKAS